MAETTTSTHSQKTNKKEIKSWWAPAFAGASVIIFAISGWGWWHYVRSNPERTFYAAIDNNFRTGSVTRRIAHENGDQNIEQNVYLNTGSQDVAYVKETRTLNGESPAIIKSEIISKPKEDYTRYNQINFAQKNADGNDLDFSPYLNIWGKTAEGSETQPPGQMYNESILSAVPTSSLSASQRGELMKFIRDNNVYKIDDAKIAREIRNGRPTYIYEVSVPAESYVGLLKKFAKTVGITQLESIEPSSYKDTPDLKFQIHVDVWSQHVKAVVYTEGGRTEALSGYGVIKHVDTPAESIPLEELQTKLQAVQ